MALLQIVCHPFERSFTYSLAGRAEAAAGRVTTVVRHDLYAEEFDPVLSGAEIARRFSLDGQIQHYSNEVKGASGYLFFHPDWWSGPPALLKGWIDRVMRPGIAYDWEGEEFAEKVHVPLLTGRSAMIFVTTDQPAGRQQESISAFWHGVCNYSGITLREVRFYCDVRNSAMHRRRAWLNETESAVEEFARTVSTRG